MTYSHTSRRLATDAKIVLERAGYRVEETNARNLWIEDDAALREGRILAIDGGTVDNGEVVRLLADHDFNEFGYPKW